MPSAPSPRTPDHCPNECVPVFLGTASRPQGLRSLHTSQAFWPHEYTRECLAIRVARRLGRYEVIEALADVMLFRGIPEHIRSDNGPEFVAKELRAWLGKVGIETLYIEPGSPWENGYCESFNGKLRDECLNGEIFYSLKEAQIVIEKWRVEYHTKRPHSALGYRPPAPAACSPWGVNPSSQPMAVI